MKQDYFFRKKIKVLKSKRIYIIMVLLMICGFFICKEELIVSKATNDYKGYSIASIEDTVENINDGKITNMKEIIKSEVNSKISNAENVISTFISKLKIEQEIEQKQIVELEESQELLQAQEQIQKIEQVKETVQIPKVDNTQKVVQTQAEEIAEPQQDVKTDIYTTPSGESYSIIGTLSIPNLEIKNSILSETSTELLNISLNKLWGPNPNEVGNMVVVGHNYRDDSTKFFSRLHKIQIGDIVKIKDTAGRVLDYTVYDTFVVNSDDVSCTSQLTDGRIEITLITCYNNGTQRFVVKARA